MISLSPKPGRSLRSLGRADRAQLCLGDGRERRVLRAREELEENGLSREAVNRADLQLLLECCDYYVKMSPEMCVAIFCYA